VQFAAHGETTIDLKLVKAGTPVDQRPDLGIGQDDVKIAGGKVEVTVHSLGAVAAGGGTVTLLGADGAVLASQPLGSLPAPTDLLPKTQTLRFTLNPVIARKGLTVRVALPGDAPEITMLNNNVTVPAEK
jgi:hypothetical protein